MSRIDWQAFEDGSMPAAERDRVEALLREDSQVRSEFDAYSRFKAGVREAGLAEPVPLDRLEKTLAGYSARPSRRPYWIGGTLAAAAVLVWFMTSFLVRPVVPDPMRLDQTPALASLATNDPVAGNSWMEETTGFALPVVDLTEVGQMEEARHGDFWASYDYKIGGETYVVSLCPCGHHYDNLPKVELASGVAAAEGQGFGFTLKGACIHVRGPDKETSRQLALSIHRQLSGSSETWGLSAKKA
jgi:hypothetical protein